MKQEESSKNLVIVGIGASAGGFEALHEFISEIPNDTDAAYVIAQHLDPAQPTMLMELLQRYTTLPIQMVKNGQTPKKNNIYICPPNNNITFQNDTFKLSTPENRMFPKPSINIFFKSLAKSKEGNTIGIIFSGTGTDGSEGIRAIKNAGGLTIVQDEKSAKYSSMPRAAVDTGCVDIISSPKLIGQEIAQFIKTPPLLTEHQVIALGFDSIYDILLDRYNVDFSEYKLGTIQRRIERRMAVRKVENLDDYVNILKSSKHEIELLYKDLLVIVTSFFRDRDAFIALKIELEKLLKESQKDQVRVWVTGCATGEEAYTISMILHRLMSELSIKKQIQIFATDISEDAIAKARNAVFSYEEIESIDKYYIDKFFIEHDNHYEIKKNIRDSIIFSKHDLIRDPSFLNIDLITCRNLLIYFNSNLQKRIFALFHHSLNSQGLLFLGKSESISIIPELFIPTSPRWKIYKKDPTYSYTNYQDLLYFPRKYSSNKTLNIKPNLDIKKETRPKQQPISKENALKNGLSIALQTNLFKDFLIIDRNNNITYTEGNVQQYLRFPDGNFNNDLFSFLKDEIKLDIRILISKARKQQAIAFNQRVKVNRENQKLVKYVNIIVVSIGDNEYITNGIAVIFMDSSDVVDLNDAGNEMNSSYLRELETELNYTKEQLQTTVEELETSNEELQSTNEELQSTNEELQSTNEELETSNEELQSTNEELTTVNDELEMRAGELKIAHNDLINIFNTIKSHIILLDKNLKIKRFTKNIDKLFVIDSTNHGDVITSIPTRYDFGNIRQDLLNLIENNQEKKFYLNSDDKIFRVNYLQYLNDDNKVDGAIILINDVTELEAEKERFSLAIEGSNDGVWDWNIKTNEVFFSPRWKTMLGYEPEEIEDSFDSWEKLVHPDDLTNAKNAIEEYFENSSEIFNITFRMKTKNDDWVWIRSRGKVQLDLDHKPIRFVGFHTDITKEIMFQEELQKEVHAQISKIREKDEQILQQAKNASLGEMIGNIAHQWRQPLSVISTGASTVVYKYESNIPITQDEIINYMNVIVQQTQYLSDTIDIFRNFLRSGQTQVLISIEEVISNTLSIVSSSIKNNYIELKNDVDYSKSTKRLLKAGELSQVLINILNNSKDAIVERNITEPWIKIAMKTTNDKVTIIIEDNGGGILENIIGKIFEPYFTTKHQSQGTGLGLYMSYKIITESLKGTIHAENTKVGAKFIIEF